MPLLLPPDMPLDIDAEFGGKEARLKLEQKLLRKLDTRMSILILIYVLNYVRLSRSCLACVCSGSPRSIGITLRKSRDVLLARSTTRSTRCFQCRSFERVRGRFASERPTIQHNSEYPLCWLHFNADTFVSILQPNSPRFPLLIDPSSNMFLNYVGRPSIYLPVCMMLWGAISCVTGQRLIFCLPAHFPTLVRRRHPQLHWSPRRSILPWVRGGGFFPWRPLSSIEVVQALGTWAPHRTACVR